MKKIDVNDISPESRIALLNFCGSFIALEKILKANGASAADIESGALDAIRTIMKEKPERKNKIEKTYLKYIKIAGGVDDE